jgi:hypothetical protein
MKGFMTGWTFEYDGGDNNAYEILVEIGYPLESGHLEDRQEDRTTSGVEPYADYTVSAPRYKPGNSKIPPVGVLTNTSLCAVRMMRKHELLVCQSLILPIKVSDAA